MSKVYSHSGFLALVFIIGTVAHGSNGATGNASEFTQSFVRTGLQTRPIGRLHTRTALESRPHSFLFVIFELDTNG